MEHGSFRAIFWDLPKDLRVAIEDLVVMLMKLWNRHSPTDWLSRGWIGFDSFIVQLNPLPTSTSPQLFLPQSDHDKICLRLCCGRVSVTPMVVCGIVVLVAQLVSHRS